MRPRPSGGGRPREGPAVHGGSTDDDRARTPRRARSGRDPVGEQAAATPRYHHSVSSTPFSARSSSSAHAFVDRYFQPPSASKQTTSPSSKSAATRWAMWITAPAEIPA